MTQSEIEAVNLTNHTETVSAARFHALQEAYHQQLIAVRKREDELADQDAMIGELAAKAVELQATVDLTMERFVAAQKREREAIDDNHRKEAENAILRAEVIRLKGDLDAAHVRMDALRRGVS